MTTRSSAVWDYFKKLPECSAQFALTEPVRICSRHIASQSKKSTPLSLTEKAQMLMMRTKIVTTKPIAREQLP
ncbi:hypothetical protein AAVH_24955 [Aphelenchoides avenae]|nr:hypothetical protein AAVH_24955 [Aphelenchus avenae]